MKQRFLCAWLALFLAPSPALAEVDCNDAEDTGATLACLERELAAAKTRTDEMLKGLAAQVAIHDENWHGEGPNGAARLAAAQSAWEASRDADCALSGFAMIGGTMEAVLTLACLKEHQDARTRWLDDTAYLFMPWGD